jgi:hypothetical protein
MLGLVGVTARYMSTAPLTVRAAEPEMLPEVAVIVAEPVPVDAARPEPLMVDTVTLEELQVTEPVRSWVVLSEKVPVAMNC